MLSPRSARLIRYANRCSRHRAARRGGGTHRRAVSSDCRVDTDHGQPRGLVCCTPHTIVRSTVLARRVTQEGFFAFASAFFTAVRATLVAGLPSKLTLQPARVLLLVIAPANASADASLIALLLSVSALRSLIGSSMAPSPGLRAVKSADAPASLMSLLSRERILRSRSAPAEICHSDAWFTDKDQAVGREASGAQGAAWARSAEWRARIARLPRWQAHRHQRYQYGCRRDEAFVTARTAARSRPAKLLPRPPSYNVESRAPPRQPSSRRVPRGTASRRALLRPDMPRAHALDGK